MKQLQKVSHHGFDMSFNVHGVLNLLSNLFICIIIIRSTKDSVDANRENI